MHPRPIELKTRYMEMPTGRETLTGELAYHEKRLEIIQHAKRELELEATAQNRERSKVKSDDNDKGNNVPPSGRCKTVRNEKAQTIPAPQA